VLKDDYFLRFEDRSPPAPLPYNPWREMLWQFLAILALVLGTWYTAWRWTSSLNADALWFAVPLVLAETFALFGLFLFVFNLWKDQPVSAPLPPQNLSEVSSSDPNGSKPLSVDLMFTTYDEDPELVRLGIRDAKHLTYPYEIDVLIHVLDDGRRSEMREVCVQEGVGYITRDTNEGFKAGNLRNALDQTSGEFIVIFDADTRPLPTLLERTLGYFRDPTMAWVQTPQWFYDLPSGTPLTSFLHYRLGNVGRNVGGIVEKFLGKIEVGRDPFVNDPQMFYEVLLRRRNWANAAFCCGAGSVHRREAVMQAALRSFAANVEKRSIAAEEDISVATQETHISKDLLDSVKTKAAIDEVLAPYRFHVSEDIFTSIMLHSDRDRKWRSVQHPFVESKMLSPQDLLTWTIQRYKYAGGSLDILFNENPLFRKGMTLQQKLMYASTFYSYLAPLWNCVFLVSPIIYLFSGISPVVAYSGDFFWHLIPFLITLELAMMVGTWGVSGYQAKASFLATFPLGLKALFAVLAGRKINFKVTPKQRQSGRFLSLVRPQIALIALSIVGALWGFASVYSGDTSHSPSGVLANSLWALNNCIALAGVISAAMWVPSDKELSNTHEIEQAEECLT